MNKRIAIFGAGMTGLVAGRELARSGHIVDIYEASDHVGGLASTYKDDDGFVYDNGPRFIFSTLAEKVGIAHLCEPVPYFEDLYVGGRYYKFPFGFIRNPRYCVSAGIATLTRTFHPKPANLYEFLRTYYGRIFSREVLIPLIEKWSGIPSAEVSIDFASRLLPTNVAYILHSLIKKLRGGVTEDYYKKGRYIVYPRGSNSVIFETLMQTPGMNVHLHSPLQRLETSSQEILGAQVAGKKIQADYYLSTVPINHLSTFIDQPGEAKSWQQFHYRAIQILFVKLKRERILEHLWTWFPEPKFPFYRIAEFKNARSDLAPSGKTLIAVEMACEITDPLWTLRAEELLARVEKDLDRLYGLKKEEILGLNLKKSSHAYPVLKKSSEISQRALTHDTPFKNLFIAGRTGMFQYRMLEGCFESAMTCVDAIQQSMKGATSSANAAIDTDGYGRPLVLHH